MRTRLVVAVGVVAVGLVTLAGCDAGRDAATAGAGTVGAGADSQGAAGQVTATGTPGPTAAVCPASASVGPGEGLSGRQGAGTGFSVWALPFPTEPTFRHGKELKVVWRITGTGDPVFTATGPGGAETRPVWGPEAHGGSNWDRPGSEYGTGWVFPSAGCWTVHIVRGEARGEYAFTIG